MTGMGRAETIRASGSSPQSGHWYFASRKQPVVNAHFRDPQETFASSRNGHSCKHRATATAAFLNARADKIY